MKIAILASAGFLGKVLLKKALDEGDLPPEKRSNS